MLHRITAITGSVLGSSSSSGTAASASTSRATPAPQHEINAPLLGRRAGRPAGGDRPRPGRSSAEALGALGEGAAGLRHGPLADARGAVRGDNANKLQELLRQHPHLLTAPFGEKAETLLTEAARAGKNMAVQAILMQALSADNAPFAEVIGHRNADGRTALELAIERGDLGMAKSLLKHEEVVNGKAELTDEVASGKAELAMAIRQGWLDVAKSLVAYGPDNTRLTSTTAALSDARGAAYLGDTNKLQALLRQNPELLTMQFGRTKETLLTEAARAGENGSVQAILVHALLNWPIEAAREGEDSPVQETLEQAPLDRPSVFAGIINHRNTHGDTALAQAIQHGGLDVVTSLLKYEQTDVTLANQYGEAPLHHAAKAENPEFAVRLLAHKEIRAGQTDDDGNTPLHLAVYWGRSETAVAIAGHPTAAPDHVNDFGHRALKMAIDSQDLLVVDTLLKHSEVTPECTDSKGRPLIWQSLVKWRYNVSLGGPETPLRRWSHLLGMLAASPRVKSNLRSPEGETPLTFLSKLSCPWDIAVPVEFNRWRNRTVQTMLEAGRRGQGQLDPEVTNTAGMTPYQVALAANNTSLAEVFLADAHARANPESSSR